MGMLDKLIGAFSSADSGGSSKGDQELNWIQLTQLGQLDDIIDRSKTKVQFIFKHSTRCGISRMAMSRFKKSYSLSENDADLYYLDLLKFRAVSNAIADKFQVRHESPQLLIIKDGVVVAHDSHSGINRLVLETFV